jgi:streptomycin 6-kinase
MRMTPFLAQDEGTATRLATIRTMSLRIPSALAMNCRRTPEGEAWLARLPDVLWKLENEWALTPGLPLDGEEPTCAYVAAVLSANKTPAVLKVAMPHMEGEQEIHGLRFWAGDPTVRLLKADDALGAMLLERCQPGTTLRLLEEHDQDVVIAGLLRRLWRCPSAEYRFRPLSALMDFWSNETQIHAEHWPDSGLVREGLRLFKELPANATREVLLATDLHAGNVLRADREAWLVIDPKPFLGDPTYDATQHLFNCWARMQADPEGTMKRLADLVGVDYERLRLWTFARAAAEPRDDWNNKNRLELARAIAP